MKPIEALLFDMDGTLLDSEPNYRIADEWFLRDLGVELPEAVWESFVGIGSATVIERVKREYGVTGEEEELLKLKDRYYRKVARDRMRVFPAAQRLLEGLRDRGIPRAIATGSTRRSLAFSLEVSGLEGWFQAAVSSDEVARGKPAPDVFLEAARRLGVAPERCLVLEDSRSGMAAAVAAKMRFVALPSVASLREDPLLHQAVITVPDGAEAMDPEAVLQLIDESRRYDPAPR